MCNIQYQNGSAKFPIPINQSMRKSNLFKLFALLFLGTAFSLSASPDQMARRAGEATGNTEVGMLKNTRQASAQRTVFPMRFK